MNHKNILSALIFVTMPLLVLAWSVVMSEEVDLSVAEQRVSERMRFHQVRKSGAEIRLGLKLTILLKRFDAFADKLALSDHGMQILATMADQEPIDSAADNAFSDAMWQEICTNIDQLSATDVAERVRAIADQFFDKREARYQLWMQQLTPADLQHLMNFVDSTVAKTATFTDADGVAVARELPVEYKLVVRQVCESKYSRVRRGSTNGLSNDDGTREPTDKPSGVVIGEETS